MAIFLITTAKATERSLESELLLRDKEKSKILLSDSQVKLTDDEVISLCCLPRCAVSCFYWFLSHIAFDNYSNDRCIHLSVQRQIKLLPSDLILVITSFLDCKDQLSLSHVNKETRSTINEKFWERQIVKQKYLIWDVSLPKAKVFFANYFYQKGFGRGPTQVEKIVDRVEDITFIPSLNLAKKSLILGFPRGRENYAQIQHKITMLKIDQICKSTSTVGSTILRGENSSLFRGKD